MKKQGKTRGIQLAAMAALLMLANFAGNAQTRKLTINLRGVYESKITLSPFNGVRVEKALGATDVVKPGDVVDFDIPVSNLPGEFLIRFDYRAKESDSPYPSELQLYINKEDITVDAHPLYLNGDSLRLGNDLENRAWFAFQKKSMEERQQMGLLQQLLAQYDQRQSVVWNDAEKALEDRRIKYNKWIDQQKLTDRGLYVSHLYSFQRLNAVNWKASSDEQMRTQANAWFNNFDVNDTLALRSRQMNEFIGGFVGLYGQRATTEALRDSLFTEAGRLACNQVSGGNPKVYGWLVDYFYNGFETYNITRGLEMLEKFSADPRCRTSRKAEIARRTEGIKKLVPGVKVNNILVHNFDDLEETIKVDSCKKNYRLLVFYESDCGHCIDLLAGLLKWYKTPENQVWLDVVSIALDRTREAWEPAFTANAFPWTDRYAPEGINSKAAADYYVLSAPYMYLVDNNGILLSIPNTIEELDGIIKGK